MAEYEIIVVCKRVYRVSIEADDDDVAQERAAEIVANDEEGDVELLRDVVETFIDNVNE